MLMVDLQLLQAGLASITYHKISQWCPNLNPSPNVAELDVDSKPVMSQGS